MVEGAKINNVGGLLAEQPPKTLVVKGIVFSGGGEGTKFMTLPWVRRQVTEKLGFTPFPGTLNIKLIREERYTEFLKKAESIPLMPIKGFSKGKCFHAYLSPKVKCAVVIPEIPNYPRDIIEIIAPINLRKECHLQDGALVEVTIPR